MVSCVEGVGGGPRFFTDMRRGAGVDEAAAFIEEVGRLQVATAAQ